MKKTLLKNWYYEYSEFPYRIVWALLKVFEDNSCQILDCRGKYYNFSDFKEAKIWLNDEEYSPISYHEDLEEEEDKLIYPILEKYTPKGNNDKEFISQMLVELPQNIKEEYFKIIGINY